MKLFKNLAFLGLLGFSGQIFGEYVIESVKGNKATIVKKAGKLGGGHNVKVEKFQGIVIDTTKNEVGIENDICAVFHDPSNKGEQVITCKSGKTFDDVCKIRGSATGTPPWLIGEPNYIGQVQVSGKSKSTKKVMGSAKRDAYFICNVHAFNENNIK